MIEITHTDYEVFMRDTKDGTSSKQKIFHSQHVIEKIIYYKLLDRIAILFHGDYYKKDGQNVICIDTKGTLLWTVPPLESEVRGNRMVDIDVRKKKYIIVFSFDCTHRLIEVETGKIIRYIYSK